MEMGDIQQNHTQFQNQFMIQEKSTHFQGLILDNCFIFSVFVTRNAHVF